MRKGIPQQIPMKLSWNSSKTYSTELGNQMDKFLDKYDLPKLNKKDISHLNRSINKQ
jgi:hypothetical protein